MSIEVVGKGPIIRVECKVWRCKRPIVGGPLTDIGFAEEIGREHSADHKILFLRLERIVISRSDHPEALKLER